MHWPPADIQNQDATDWTKLDESNRVEFNVLAKQSLKLMHMLPSIVTLEEYIKKDWSRHPLKRVEAAAAFE